MKIIWDLGENIATKYLEKKWYHIIKNNYKIFGGEIDIIAMKDNIYIFVEVKFRKNSDFIHPIELFNKKKAEPFLRAVYNFMNENDIEEENIRIDLIAIIPKIPQSKWYQLFHARGIDMTNLL